MLLDENEGVVTDDTTVPIPAASTAAAWATTAEAVVERGGTLTDVGA